MVLNAMTSATCPKMGRACHAVTFERNLTAYSQCTGVPVHTRCHLPHRGHLPSVFPS